MVDANGLNAINEAAQKTKDAVDQGNWLLATDYWSQTETVVEVVSCTSMAVYKTTRF